MARHTWHDIHGTILVYRHLGIGKSYIVISLHVKILHKYTSTSHDIHRTILHSYARSYTIISLHVKILHTSHDIHGTTPQKPAWHDIPPYIARHTKNPILGSILSMSCDIFVCRVSVDRQMYVVPCLVPCSVVP